MKILVLSYRYPPSIGGIETVGGLLVEYWRKAGHLVRVVTATQCENDTLVDVYRNPSRMMMIRLYKWSDVVFHNNLSLTYAWPSLIVWRPNFVTHHIWFEHGGWTWKSALRRVASSCMRSIAISEAILSRTFPNASLIYDPYDDRVFRFRKDAVRKKDIVFVGRIVSDKGLNVLISAIAILHPVIDQLTCTIVGDGPDLPELRKRVIDAQLEDCVYFTGELRGEALAIEMAAHRLIVVPSIWEEPFGLVAIEGLACGCYPVVTDSGGLPEAVGEFGIVVPRGDSEALAKAVQVKLESGDTWPDDTLVDDVETHLQKFRPKAVSNKYLNLFNEALGDGFCE